MSPPTVSAIRSTSVASLRKHPGNPRKIGPSQLAQLKAQLEADPEMLKARPLIALPDGTVIAGNQRLAAAVELGWDKIPVATVDLDEAQARVWMLRDNTQAGEWDDALLADLLAGLPTDLDVTLTGLEQDVLDRLRRPARNTDPDEAPPIPDVPRSKLGEVYELGDHRLMCGDSTDPEQMATLMGGSLARCVWTDPPYGVSYEGRTGDRLTIQGDDLRGDDLHALLVGALSAAAGVSQGGAAAYVCHSDSEGTQFRDAFAEAGWTLTQVLIWVKNHFVLGRQDYHWQHEPILYGRLPGRRFWQGGRKAATVVDVTPDLSVLTRLELEALVSALVEEMPGTVVRVARPSRSESHPTMKPVALIEGHVKNSCGRGAIVLDPFGGSGSTLIACERLGRKAFLMEIDPAYCDVIRDRYEAFVA